jgi:hypothetical protein
MTRLFDDVDPSYNQKPIDYKLETGAFVSSVGMAKPWPPKYKYKEDQIISDFHAYIDKTYGQHYMTEEQNIECFDVWLALGETAPTFRNTAIKYLWRYGKKSGSNKDDLMKVLHYTLMMLYTDHYKDKK